MATINTRIQPVNPLSVSLKGVIVTEGEIVDVPHHDLFGASCKFAGAYLFYAKCLENRRYPLSQALVRLDQ